MIILLTPYRICLITRVSRRKGPSGSCFGALQFKVINESPFVQVLHTVRLQWVAISTIGCNNGEVCIMDSLFHRRMPQKTKHQICSLMEFKKAKIVVNFLPLVITATK